MKQYKIRTIVKSKEMIKLGITIPKNITTFYPEDTYFKIEMFGAGSVILISGTLIKPSDQDVKNYNFEDVII